MEYLRDRFILSSGRIVPANNGNVSVRRDDNGFHIYEGYDSCILGASGEAWWEDPERDPNWTNEEKRELADYVIQQWQEYRRAHE